MAIGSGLAYQGQKPDEHANHVALNGTVIDTGDEFVDPEMVTGYSSLATRKRLPPVR